MKVNTKDLSRLAGAVLDADKELSGGWRRFTAESVSPAGAFGNLAVSGAVYEGLVRLAGSTDTAAESLTGVLESDVDRLYQATAAYEQSDHDSSVGFDRMRLDPKEGG